MCESYKYDEVTENVWEMNGEEIFHEVIASNIIYTPSSKFLWDIIKHFVVAHSQAQHIIY